MFGLYHEQPQLRKWADVFVIAPLDANTLAKLANGLCDNLLVRTVCPSLPALPLASLANEIQLLKDMCSTGVGLSSTSFCSAGNEHIDVGAPFHR
jgi:hypothetical protein